MERKELPSYELRVSKTGTKLRGADMAAEQKPGVRANFSVVGGRQIIRIVARSVPIAAMLPTLRSSLDAPLIDRTGLTGKYSFELEFGKDIPGSVDSAGQSDPPDLFAALRQQLGLMVESTKATFDVVVVDRVNREPAEN